ncbi:unnamed protein product, partial [Trichogramma brassicae]
MRISSSLSAMPPPRRCSAAAATPAYTAAEAAIYRYRYTRHLVVETESSITEYERSAAILSLSFTYPNFNIELWLRYISYSYTTSSSARLLTFSYLTALNCWLVLCPTTLSHDWQMGSVPLVTSLADSRNLATCLFFTTKTSTTGPRLDVPRTAVLARLEFTHNRGFRRGGTSTLHTQYRLDPADRLRGPAHVADGAASPGPRRRRHGSAARGRLLSHDAAQSRLVVEGDAAARGPAIAAGQRQDALQLRQLFARHVAGESSDSALSAGPLITYSGFLFNIIVFRIRSIKSPERRYAFDILMALLWPTYASAHNNLGTLTVGDQAEKHFLAAIQAQPGHVNAHYNLGQLYRKTNRTEECIKMLQKCVALDPAYTPAYLVLARMTSGSATGALLRHVVRLQPKSPDYLAEYASWLHQNGKWLQALKYYLKGLEISPVHRSSLLGTARILRSRGQWPRVHQLITRKAAAAAAAAVATTTITTVRGRGSPASRCSSSRTATSPSSSARQRLTAVCAPAGSRRLRPTPPRPCRHGEKRPRRRGSRLRRCSSRISSRRSYIHTRRWQVSINRGSFTRRTPLPHQPGSASQSLYDYTRLRRPPCPIYNTGGCAAATAASLNPICSYVPRILWINIPLYYDVEYDELLLLLEAISCRPHRRSTTIRALRWTARDPKRSGVAPNRINDIILTLFHALAGTYIDLAATVVRLQTSYTARKLASRASIYTNPRRVCTSGTLSVRQTSSRRALTCLPTRLGVNGIVTTLKPLSCTNFLKKSLCFRFLAVKIQTLDDGFAKASDAVYTRRISRIRKPYLHEFGARLEFCRLRFACVGAAAATAAAMTAAAAASFIFIFAPCRRLRRRRAQLFWKDPKRCLTRAIESPSANLKLLHREIYTLCSSASRVLIFLDLQIKLYTTYQKWKSDVSCNARFVLYILRGDHFSCWSPCKIHHAVVRRHNVESARSVVDGQSFQSADRHQDKRLPRCSTSASCGIETSVVAVTAASLRGIARKGTAKILSPNISTPTALSTTFLPTITATTLPTTTQRVKKRPQDNEDYNVSILIGHRTFKMRNHFYIDGFNRAPSCDMPIVVNQRAFVFGLPNENEWLVENVVEPQGGPPRAEENAAAANCDNKDARSDVSDVPIERDDATEVLNHRDPSDVLQTDYEEPQPIPANPVRGRILVTNDENQVVSVLQPRNAAVPAQEVINNVVGPISGSESRSERGTRRGRGRGRAVRRWRRRWRGGRGRRGGGLGGRGAGRSRGTGEQATVSFGERECFRNT